MNWRSAKALITLLNQINELFPDRNKSWDGTIASMNHHNQNPNSDHEARDFDDGNGSIVTAMDITHDVENGVDSYKLADALLATHDSRIKYIISNSRIGGDEAYAKRNGATPWTWRKYKGANPHDHHVHISVNGVKAKYDSTKPWDLSGYTGKPKKIIAATEEFKGYNSDRMKAAGFILNYEARRDSHGRLCVYPLPKGDGGGTYEVAGINDRYHPEEAAALAKLIRAGKFAEAELQAAGIIATYTDLVGAWHTSPKVVFILRDCAFNRGPRGAAIIYQKAVGAVIDGSVGPKTLEAGNSLSADELVKKLRSAREWYERKYANRNEKSKFWKGLVNRWNKVVEDSNNFEG